MVAVVRVLKLSKRDTGYCEEGEARHLLLQAAIDFLGERRKSANGENETHLYDDLLHHYEHKITEIDKCGPDGGIPEDTVGLTMGQLLLETIRREREELNLLRASGRIGDGVHRSLEHELDLSESRLS